MNVLQRLVLRIGHLTVCSVRAILDRQGNTTAYVQDGVDVETFERLASSLEREPEWQLLLRLRPRFQKETVDLDALAAYPDGTLGRELLRHLIDHDLLGGERHPPSPYEASEAGAYAKIRFRETHDVRHVLTGLGTSVHDEIVLQAFQAGHFFNWFAIVITMFGVFYEPRRCLRPSMIRTWHRAWRAGRDARPLFPVFWERLYDRTVLDLRRQFQVARLGHRP